MHGVLYYVLVMVQCMAYLDMCDAVLCVNVTN